MNPTTCRGNTLAGYRCQNSPSSGYYCHLHQPGSRYISESTREEVFSSSQGRCHYCNKQLVFNNRFEGRGKWEPDHLRPYSQGGSNYSDNLVAACYDCNRARSDTSVRDFGNGYRRCEGFLSNGNRCSFQVAQGNYKYCGHHSSS